MLPQYIVLDFETFYDKDYSLRKMTPVEYILDPRFECIGCSVTEGDDGVSVFLEEDELRGYLLGKREAQKRGGNLVVISHNALFDMCLLAWRFGILPDLMIDTMGIARAKVNAFTGSVSLASVAQHLGLGVKGDTLGKVAGLHKADIKAAGLWGAYSRYACNDGDLCRDIWKRFRGDFPKDELLVMDMVLRMAVTPRFKLDQGLLAEHLAKVRADKRTLLARTGLTTRDDLMSDDKFAAALHSLGVEPGTKTSPKTGKETYAFAKTDPFMADLDEHENPDVQALAAARLGFKSTGEETRTQRLLSIARLTWPGDLGTGWMPVPLKYSGAHTHRLSGDWSINAQNLGRGSPIRFSLEAPDGYVVVVADASQIEARLVAWQAGQDDLVDAFAKGRDVYSEFAGQKVYFRTVSKETPKERFVGKTCLAEGTLVYTDQGLVPIERVTPQHRIWDGEEWVGHKGTISNGSKPTLPLCGIWLTPDHLVWSGTQWREAQSLERDAGILSQALATAAASLPSPVTCGVAVGGSGASSSDATVGVPNTRSIRITSRISRALVATYARKKRHGKRGIGPTLKRWPTTGTERAFSIASHPPSPAATSRHAASSSTMVVEASASIPSGVTTGRASSATCRPFLAGTTRASKWIGGTPTGTTNPATSGLPPVRSTWPTGEGSKTSRRRLPVYDICSAGPRHRFMVQTEAGPLIVHNCVLGLGYGMGAPKFQASIISQSRLVLGQALEMPDDEAKRIVKAYRDGYAKIPAAWKTLDALIPRMAHGNPNAYFGPCLVKHQEVVLPNGLSLYYPKLTQEVTPRGSQWVFRNGRRIKFLWGGTFLENLTQALARICNFEAALRLHKEYPRFRLAHQVHDELIYVVPGRIEVEPLPNGKTKTHVFGPAKEFLQAVITVLSTPPAWGPDIPLAAEGDAGPNYGACK